MVGAVEPPANQRSTGYHDEIAQLEVRVTTTTQALLNGSNQVFFGFASKGTVTAHLFRESWNEVSGGRLPTHGGEESH